MNFIKQLFGMLIYCQFVAGIQTCPYNVFQSGFSNDVANMIATVRNSDVLDKSMSSYDKGVCGEYTQILIQKGIYNSSFRLLKNKMLNTLVGIFNVQDDNWIQNSKQDEYDKKIQLVKPIYLNVTHKNETNGLVVEHFQDIFLDIIHKLPLRLFKDEFRRNKIILGSYGIGGALNTFLATYMYYQYNITVDMILNMGAPFMSDREFDVDVIAPLREKMGQWNWWNIEVVNIIDATLRDSTSESFNRNRSPFVYINWSMLCVAYIVPYFDVEIHDPLNYKVPLIGFNCD